MHEQIVRRIVLQTEVVGDTGRHGDGRYAGVADQRIDLLVLRQEEVEELHEEHARRRGDDKRHEAEGEDADGLRGQELRCLSGGADGHAEQYGDDVGQGVAGSLGQTGAYAALAKQVAEEEHAQQGYARRHHEAGQQKAEDREYDLLVLRHGAGRLHLDQTLLLGGEQAHQRRLDHRHQSHVGVGRHCDSAHQVGSQFRRQEYGRGAVGAADDGYGTGLVGREAQKQGHHVGAEDAELGGRADKHQLRIGYQSREVGHGAYAEEYQRRIPSGRYAVVEDVEHGALLIDAHVEAGGGVERNVAYEYAEADRHQEHRLEVFLDGKPDKEKTYGQHDEMLPCGVVESCKDPELMEVVG